jgi:hypothetical protein
MVVIHKVEIVLLDLVPNSNLVASETCHETAHLSDEFAGWSGVESEQSVDRRDDQGRVEPCAVLGEPLFFAFWVVLG